MTSGKILIVDDMEANRDILSEFIRLLGYVPILAENGQVALGKIKKEHPVLVLLDILMPLMDGYEVLRRLRADPDWRSLPVIIISSVDQLDGIVRCIEYGADDYLTKPFNFSILKARIGACIKKERYRRQIEEEKRRSDGLLRSIFPKGIFEELKATGKVEPRRREEVAVLFCDVAGFTGFCEANTAETVLFHLREFVELLEGISDANGLQKLKTVGDSFIATRGLTGKVKNPTMHCVRAGLEIIRALPSLRSGWKVRIGIHIGPVVAGVVGSRQYLFDVFGDTVNTAERVEHHGAVNAVNLSGEAWRRCGNGVVGKSLGLTTLKGKKKKIEIYRVSSIPEERPRHIPNPLGKFGIS